MHRACIIPPITISLRKLTTASSIREVTHMQNRRARDWRMANSSNCNGTTSAFDVANRTNDVCEEMEPRLGRSAHISAFTSIINIIIVMSTVGNTASTFYTSRMLHASEPATLPRRCMLTTIKQRCFMLSESRMSRQQGRDNAGETAIAKHIRMCARLNEESPSCRPE